MILSEKEDTQPGQPGIFVTILVGGLVGLLHSE